MSAHLRIDTVDEIQEIATYMQKKFAETMLNIDHPHLRPEVFIPIPEDWSLEYTIEVDLAVAIIAQAFDNQGNRPTSPIGVSHDLQKSCRINNVGCRALCRPYKQEERWHFGRL